MEAIVPVEVIEGKIHLIHGQKVMLDNDLAELYGVETFNLNKAVKRNIDRFPQDFMFQLTREEYNSLRFQFGILKRGRRSKSVSAVQSIGHSAPNLIIQRLQKGKFFKP